MLTTLILFGSLFHHRKKPPAAPAPLDPKLVELVESSKGQAIKAAHEYPALMGLAEAVYADSLVLEKDNSESLSLLEDLNNLIADIHSLRWAEEAYDKNTRA